MSSPYIKKLPAGGHHTVLQYFNMSGSVLIVIRTQNGDNIIPNCWWINGLGIVSNLGKKTDQFTTKIAWNKLFLGAKLRVATAQKTVLYIYDSSSADYLPGMPVEWDW